MKTFFCTLLALLSTACAQQPTQINSPTLAVQSITVTAAPSTIGAGGASALTAYVIDGTSSQNIFVSSQCTWTSSNTAIFTVNGPTATGVATGTASATCTLPDGSSGMAPITVAASPLITNPSTAFCNGANPCVLPGGTNGSAYSYTFTAQDNISCCTWAISVGSLPTGITLNTATGVISGTPTVNGTSNFTIQATDTLPQSTSLAVSITIAAAPTCNGNFGGIATLPCASTSTAHPGRIDTFVPFSASTPSGTVNTQNTATGGCTPTASQGCMTKVSGDSFVTTWMTGTAKGNGGNILVNGTAYRVDSWNSTTVATIDPLPGTQTGVSYTNFTACKPGSSNNAGNGCQNSTGFDKSIPGYILNSGCITRVSDQGSSTQSGQSVGNFTTSSGGSDSQISLGFNGGLDHYLGVSMQGGNNVIYHLTTATVNGVSCVQVVNTGLPGITFAGAFAFSKQTANTYYWNNQTGGTNKTEIDTCTINSDSSTTCTKLIDFMDAGVCPGVTAFKNLAGSPGILAVDYLDDSLGVILGPGSGQGSAFWAMVWSRTKGCSTANFQTGQAWAFCTSSCSSSTPALVNAAGVSTFLGNVNTTATSLVYSGANHVLSVVSTTNMFVGQTLSIDTGANQENVVVATIPPQVGSGSCISFGYTPPCFTATFAKTHSASTGFAVTYTSPACWGAPGNGSLQNFHDGVLAFGGTYMHLNLNSGGTWTQGACAGSSASNQQIIWQAGTLTNTFVAATPTYQAGGHYSDGLSNFLSPYYGGPNIRPLATPLATPTVFAAPTTFTDSHPLYWAHYCAGTGATPNDACPNVNESDSVTTAQGTQGTGNCPAGYAAVYCPPYLANVIFVWSVTSLQNPFVLAHTFSCNPSGYSNGTAGDGFCNGIADPFGLGNAIGQTSPDGTLACWGSVMLGQLGTDSAGKRVGSVFCLRP